MKGWEKTQGDVGTWGDTCEICNQKIHSINCIAYVLEKNCKKGTIFIFLTFNASKDRKQMASLVIQIKYYKINV
jgi:hypothetical protein